MTRILVDPEALQSLASQFDQVAEGLQELGRRSSQSLAQSDWEAQSLRQAEGQMEAAGRLGASLSHELFAFGRSLRETAERFRVANAWRPSWSGGASGQSGAASAPSGEASVAGMAATGGAFAAGTAAGGAFAAGTVAGPGTSRGSSPTPGTAAQDAVVAPADPMAILYAHFPDLQRRAILAHVVKAEGMDGAHDAHGGVVYWDDDGHRKSDRQWLNFGYISFATPGGTGGDVLRRIFAIPGEAEAFREIALRHLQDQPSSDVPASHSHLLRQAGTEIPALSASDQANQFVRLIKAGKDETFADWFFKYGNTPAVERDNIANGHLRPEWKAIMAEFLGRPASVQAQIQQIDQGYLTPAIASAERFGLHSTLGIAWFTDQHVQSGTPNEAMEAMLGPAPDPGSRLYDAWQRYQSGDEMERLQVLTELSGGPGSTVRARRKAVLADNSLTLAPFAGLA